MKSCQSIVTRTVLCCALLAPISSPVLHAQSIGDASISYLGEPKPALPETMATKLKNLQSRFDKEFARLSAFLKRLPTEPDLLGTKELFAVIDQSDRAMKKIRAGGKSLVSALRAEAGTIQGSKSFSDGQKKELLESAEAIAKDASELTQKLDTSLNRLAAAYTVLPKWKTIHRSYRNLQGDAKAAEEVKVQVTEYLQSFTQEPEQIPQGAQAAGNSPAQVAK